MAYDNLYISKIKIGDQHYSLRDSECYEGLNSLVKYINDIYVDASSYWDAAVLVFDNLTEKNAINPDLIEYHGGPQAVITGNSDSETESETDDEFEYSNNHYTLHAAVQLNSNYETISAVRMHGTECLITDYMLHTSLDSILDIICDNNYDIYDYMNSAEYDDIISNYEIAPNVGFLLAMSKVYDHKISDLNDTFYNDLSYIQDDMLLVQDSITSIEDDLSYMQDDITLLQDDIDILLTPKSPTYDGETVIATHTYADILITNNEKNSTIVYMMAEDESEYSTAIVYENHIRIYPTAESTNYSFKAISRKNNRDSDYLEFSVTIQRKVPTPIISIDSISDKYEASRQVTIDCLMDDATIYYTTDGTIPTTESNEYEEPIIVTETQTINAIAICTDYMDSEQTEPVLVEVNVPRIYYGVSPKTTMESTNDITGLDYYKEDSDSVAGSYNIISLTNGYIWFCIPSNMTINSIQAGCFNVPMNAPIIVDSHKCYRSVNEQLPINDIFVIE